jgi:DNA-binding transcriptional regulator GbsR (MarR family)
MTNIQQSFIQEFGEAYHRFGLPKLMGRIVGLLLYAEEPLSLDEVTQHLNVSKGPVSQMLRRLRDRQLIERIWVPGDRRDFYVAAENIFARAYENQITLVNANLDLARRFHKQLSETDARERPRYKRRLERMLHFYELMLQHNRSFLKQWKNQ